MKLFVAKILFLLSMLILAGCTSVETKKTDIESEVVGNTLLATGFSKIHSNPGLTENQNRLTIEQDAKLNAYRQLANQLYAVKLSDDHFVADRVIRNEAYRIYLDLFIREARIIQSKNIADQKMVQLELLLPPRFYHCLSSTVAVVTQCIKKDNKIPFTRIGYQQAEMNNINLSCATVDCGVPLTVSGFSKSKNVVDSAMLSMGLYDTEWTSNLALRSLIQYFFPTGYLIN